MGGYPSGANGRARVNPRSPSAFALCDRCGFRWNHVDLTWQYEWSGNQLVNRRILVCPRCTDLPQEQLRSYAVPPDPLPIHDPRPDMSDEGNAPIVVTTTACVSAQWLRDGYGKLILDGYGNPIMSVPGTYGTLLTADPTRSMVDFALPPSFGLFINPFGGVADPVQQDTVFYAPGSSYAAIGITAQSAITYFTTISGLTIVVQTQ